MRTAHSFLNAAETILKLGSFSFSGALGPNRDFTLPPICYKVTGNLHNVDGAVGSFTVSYVLPGGFTGRSLPILCGD